jgi:hypothetical protein
VEDEDEELTKEEKNAIRSLERLSRRWPKSLWLFSANGQLHVMKRDGSGRRRVAQAARGSSSLMDGSEPEVVDRNASVALVDIPNDGGDW